MLTVLHSTKIERPPELKITCRCGHVIFRDGVIYSKVVNAVEGKARCRCKRWVDVPIYWERCGIDATA